MEFVIYSNGETFSYLSLLSLSKVIRPIQIICFPEHVEIILAFNDKKNRMFQTFPESINESLTYKSSKVLK